MPLYASAFFVPTSAGIPYILEDIYLRGGYRSVATLADMYAIKPASRKAGMLCYVREDSTLYEIKGPATSGDAAWTKADLTRYINYEWQQPLAMEKDETTGAFKVSIDEKRIVPVIDEASAGWILTADPELGPVWVKLDALPVRDAASVGDALILDAQKNPIWGQIKALPSTEGVETGSSLVLGADGPAWGSPQQVGRINIEEAMDVIIVAGTAQKAVDIQCNTAMVLRLAVSHPDLYVEIHSTNAYNDSNPYSFLSSPVKLEDDGVTTLEDASELRARRYGFFSNPNDGDKKMYIRVENRGQESANVTLSMILLPME